MKKKLIALGVIIVIIIIIIGICFVGNGEYFKNTTIKKLKTFTSMTGIELNVKKEDEKNDAIIYNYVIDNNADGLGAIYKYEEYLKEYGFEKDEEYSTGEIATYKKDQYAIMTTYIEISDNIIQYAIIIPKDKNLKTNSDESTNNDISDEKEIENFKNLINEKKYSEAVDYFNNSNLYENHFDNSDEIKKYFFYAEANEYLESGFYGDSYELLAEFCVDFLDSNEILVGINEKVGELNGVYENTSVGYSGMYICIKNGSVATGFAPVDSSVYNLKNVSYTENLKDYTYTTGEKAYAIQYITSEEPSYIIQKLENDKLLIAAPAGSDATTFSGVYEKRTTNLP